MSEYHDSFKQYREDMVKVVNEALVLLGGNKRLVARTLGINYNTVLKYADKTIKCKLTKVNTVQLYDIIAKIKKEQNNQK